MTRQITLLVSGSLVMFSTLSVAETLTVTVLNEQNKGIRSRVIYKTGPVPAVLGDTNADGALTKDFSCTSGEVLSAKPFDKGSYFESTEEPCQMQMLPGSCRDAWPVENCRFLIPFSRWA